MVWSTFNVLFFILFFLFSIFALFLTSVEQFGGVCVFRIPLDVSALASSLQACLSGPVGLYAQDFIWVEQIRGSQEIS